MATNPQLTPAEFAHKWRGISTGERASAQAQVMDLCRMFGEPTPHEADPIGEWFAFENGEPAVTPRRIPRPRGCATGRPAPFSADQPELVRLARR